MIFHSGTCHLKLVTPQLAFVFVWLDGYSVLLEQVQQIDHIIFKMLCFLKIN